MKLLNTVTQGLNTWKIRPVIIFVDVFWAKAATSKRTESQEGKKLQSFIYT